MSDYVYFLDKLRETEGRIARMEAKLSEDPSDFGLEIGLRSLLAMQERLRFELAESAAQNQVEICDYRLLLDKLQSRYSAKAVALSIGAFQELFTMVYHVIQYGKRSRGRVGEETVGESTLDFGYVYTGSLGVVFTVPNENMLFEARLDEAIEQTFGIMKLESPEQVLDVARRLGLAPIRKLYDWSMANYRSGFATDITWRRGQTVKRAAYVSRADAAHMGTIISRSSSENIETLKVSGVLVGFDMNYRTFHFAVPDGETFQGRLGRTFATSPTVEVGGRFAATIQATHTVSFATDEERTSYTLMGLQTERH